MVSAGQRTETREEMDRYSLLSSDGKGRIADGRVTEKKKCDTAGGRYHERMGGNVTVQ